MSIVHELGALRRKYREIVRLRELAAVDATRDPRRDMAALAAEFPGSLREADELPMEELHLRLQALGAAEAGMAPVEPWMTAMIRFHALTRGALCAKKWLGGKKTVDAKVEDAFDAAVAAFCYARDAEPWRNDLRRIADPPNGRVTDLVFERIAVELGLSDDEARKLVFAPRRRRTREA